MISLDVNGEIYSRDIDVKRINDLISMLKSKYRDLSLRAEFSHMLFINLKDENCTTLIASIFKEDEKIKMFVYHGLYNFEGIEFNAFKFFYDRPKNSTKLSINEAIKEIPQLIYFISDFDFN